MTSKSLFFNLLKEDFRRRLWTFILASLVFFGTFVVVFTMLMQNWVNSYGDILSTAEMTRADRIVGRVTDFIGFNPWLAVVACVGAVICGVSGFAFLHSKKQVDFFHSLPLKREFIFAVRFVNGLLIYAIPYLIGLLYVYLITAVSGAMRWEVIWAGTVGFILHLMGYTIMYLVTILAVLLTGKLLIAFLGIVVLNGYVPLVYAFSQGLQEVFFVTRYADSTAWEDILLYTKWFSPISYYVELFRINTMQDFWLEVLTFLILAAVLTALCIWLYKKRLSEKSETAMSFQITEPVVRILIAVPVGVLAGFLFFTIQYESGNRTGSLLWLIFGCVLGAFLAHGIIESLYKGDVKKALSHKVQLGLTIAAAVVVPLLFYFDVFGYDSYLPEKDEVKYMALATSELRFGGGSYRDEDGNWISATEYALEEMTITEIDALYELAAFLSENALENRENGFFGYYTHITNDSYPGEKVRRTEFVIKYGLKDGSEAVRVYEYNFYEVLELLEMIYNDVEYRRSTHPIFSLEEAGWDPYQIYYTSPVSEITFGFTAGVDEIMEVYKQEILSLRFEDLTNTGPAADIEVLYTLGETRGASLTMLVYPSMTRTLELLNYYGCETTPLAESKNISSLQISYYGGLDGLTESAKAQEYAYYRTESDDYGYSAGIREVVDEEELLLKYGILAANENEIVISITDQEEIRECLSGLIAERYQREYGPFPEVEESFYVTVHFESTVKPSESNVYEIVDYESDFRFLEGSVPEFLKERLEEVIKEMH